MRLREIQKVLTENSSLLAISVSALPNSQFQLSNILNAKKGILNIEPLGLFEQEIASLKQTNFFSYAGEPINTTQQENSLIVNNVNSIKKKTEQLYVA